MVPKRPSWLRDWWWWRWNRSTPNKVTSVANSASDIYFYRTTVLSHWDFSPGKFGLLSPGKVSCDRVAVLHLRCMLGVLVFHNPPNSNTDYRTFNVRTVLCMQLHTGMYGHRRKRVCTDSWPWEKNTFAVPGNRTCLSSVPVRRSTNWAAYSPNLTWWLVFWLDDF